MIAFCNGGTDVINAMKQAVEFGIPHGSQTIIAPAAHITEFHSIGTQTAQGLAAAGKCVLFSTHLLDQAEALCHRVGVIAGGKILAEGTIPELKRMTGSENLRQAFFALVEPQNFVLVE